MFEKNMHTNPAAQRFVTRRLPVPPGLHILRYVSAVDRKRPPLVFVAPKPDESEGLELVFSPGSLQEALSQVGECVVIRSQRPSAVLVTTASNGATRSDEVELRVERLDAATDGPSPRVQPEPSVPAPARSAPDPYAGIFELQGHVQRGGDCASGAEGWLGAPGSADRIEAFGVSWQRPAPGLRLHYGCSLEDQSQHVAKLPGQLVGSRGLALGITEVRFELGGKRAMEFELVVTAAFQGGALRTVAGRQIALSGPTGAERMTGLKIGLREVSQARPLQPLQPAPSLPAVQTAAPAVVQASHASVPTGSALATAGAPAVRSPGERPKIRVFRASRPAV